MKDDYILEMDHICEDLSARTLPRWNELPDLELYMDQVLGLIARYLGDSPGEKGLTASMVNNYVKLGIMPAPVKKKYARTHLAYLLILCVMKPAFPLPSIRDLIRREIESSSEEAFYDSFCELYEETYAAVSKTVRAYSQSDSRLTLASVFAPALRAQAEQALALRLMAAAFPSDSKSN